VLISGNVLDFRGRELLGDGVPAIWLGYLGNWINGTTVCPRVVRVLLLILLLSPRASLVGWLLVGWLLVLVALIAPAVVAVSWLLVLLLTAPAVLVLMATKVLLVAPGVGGTGEKCKSE